jgi:hypothetical protein
MAKNQIRLSFSTDTKCLHPLSFLPAANDLRQYKQTQDLFAIAYLLVCSPRLATDRHRSYTRGNKFPDINAVLHTPERQHEFNLLTSTSRTLFLGHPHPRRTKPAYRLEHTIPPLRKGPIPKMYISPAGFLPTNNTLFLPLIRKTRTSIFLFIPNSLSFSQAKTL